MPFLEGFVLARTSLLLLIAILCKRNAKVPTIVSHAIVALSIAPCFGRKRVPLPAAALGACCAILPDFDVVGLRLGIPYDSLLGHRGFSHSLLFAGLLAGMALAGYRTLTHKTAGWPLFLFLFLCGASHGLLDALTNGGLGVAFFSPFDQQRYFFPWQPIEVSPLRLSSFMSGKAWPVLRSELLWLIIPSFALASATLLLRRRRMKKLTKTGADPERQPKVTAKSYP